MERRPILVVDDDEVIRSSVELALADEGYPVASAPNGAIALHLVAWQQPALILLI
jgi:CheY-like chemotaxis protein